MLDHTTMCQELYIFYPGILHTYMALTGIVLIRSHIFTFVIHAKLLELLAHQHSDTPPQTDYESCTL